MASNEEKPRWRAYASQKPDMFGYAKEQYGVREQYADGSTRYIHNETFESQEDAERIAARFNLNAQKGQTYDNVMKVWR